MKKGFTLIELMIVIAIIAIIASIAIPNLLRARMAGNEAAAIGAMQTIATSQALFREGDKDGDLVLDYGTLLELDTANLIESVLGRGTKSGYDVDLTEVDVDFWNGVAWPHSPLSGERYFYSDQLRWISPGVCGNGVLEPGEWCDPGSRETSRLCGFGGWYCRRDCACASINVDNYDSPPNLPTGPTSSLAAREAALTKLDNQGQDLIGALLQMAPGATTEPAIELLENRKTVTKILNLMDANADGKLSLEEMTTADVIGIAKQLAGNLDIQAPGLKVDEDKARALLEHYQRGLEEAILPDMTEDEELPRLPIKGLRSSVNADLLKMFPPSDVVNQQ